MAAMTSERPSRAALALSRRRIILGGLAGLLAGAAPSGSRAAAPASSRPRYFINIFLRGGLDAVYAWDPKTRRQVESSIDVPYGANAILDGAGLPLGPGVEALRPWADRFSVLRGVQLGTANHPTGQAQIARMKTSGVVPGSPGVLDIIGQSRDGQAVGCLSLNAKEHSPLSLTGGYPTGDTTQPTRGVLEALDTLAPDELDVLASGLHAQADELPRRGSGRALQRSADNARLSAALVQRLRAAPAFTAGPASVRLTGNEASLQPEVDAAWHNLQRAAWAFEHDLTKCVHLRVCSRPLLEWDSHFGNHMRQTMAAEAFFPLLADFFGQLQRRRNAFGPLADNTVIVVGSELGRFPRLNSDGGKDHFPEAPYLVVGPRLQPGAFGQTDRQMRGQPVSLRTGAVSRSGGHHLRLDDLGATLLHLAGIDPEPYGYTGRVLRFLVGP